MLRVLFVFALAAALFIAWQLIELFVLALGAIVIAVLLRSIADPIRNHTPLSDALSVVAAILILLVVASAAAWLFRWRLAEQLSGLSALLPHSLASLRTRLSALPFGSFISDHLLSDGNMMHGLAGRLGGFAINAVSGVFEAIVAIFMGVFLAFEPRRSRDGFLLLVPRSMRPAMAEALDVSGRALRLWLIGIAFEMLTVGLLTGIGAWLVGLPAAIALGVIGGLAEVVPYVGPVISAVPGLLVGLSQGWTTVLWTLVMYLAIHQLEGNLIYPFIQKRAANLPPVLTLLAVLIASVLFGVVGVILASPLLVVGLTFTKLLYVRRTLGEATPVAGELNDGNIG